MNYEEFKTEVLNQFTNYLPENLRDCCISLHPVHKVNRELDGITLSWPKDGQKSSVSPMLYLDYLFQDYKRIGNFERIIKDAVECLSSALMSPDSESISETFINRTDRIILAVVNSEKNRLFLKEIPHKDIMDLSIIYKYFYEIHPGSFASAIVTNGIMNDLGFDENSLYECAFENTKRLLYPTVELLLNKINSQLSGKTGLDWSSENNFDYNVNDVIDSNADFPKVYIITNNSCMNGASALLFDDLLHDVSISLNSGFYILPSSVHEILVITAEGTDPADLCKIVKEANSDPNCVKPEDILSDNIYFYNGDERKLSMIENIYETTPSYS